jgi:hypothetical protein
VTTFEFEALSAAAVKAAVAGSAEPVTCHAAGQRDAPLSCCFKTFKRTVSALPEEPAAP